LFIIFVAFCLRLGLNETRNGNSVINHLQGYSDVDLVLIYNAYLIEILSVTHTVRFSILG